MRLPTVLLSCKVMSGVSVVVMTAGSITEHPWLRGWSLLVAVYAVGLCLRAAVERAAREVMLQMKKWAHKPFEDGLKAGVELGREMEATERFIASTREQD